MNVFICGRVIDLKIGVLEQKENKIRKNCYNLKNTNFIAEMFAGVCGGSRFLFQFETVKYLLLHPYQKLKLGDLKLLPSGIIFTKNV